MEATKQSWLEQAILNIKEETVLDVQGKFFVITPATEADIARVNSGIIMD